MSAPPDNSPAQRASRRRNWPGAITTPGEPKPALHEPSFTEARLVQMWQHCVRQWRASGRELVHVPRSQMPGEIFRIHAGSRDGGD